MSTRYVALLRGVNVGGRTSLKMDALRSAFTDLGFDDVATYIQSGNVVFTSPGPVDDDDLGSALSGALDRELTVILRTGTQLQAVIDATPFASMPPKERHVAFLAAAPDRSAVAGLDLTPFAPEAAEVIGSEVHLHLPNGMGRAKLPTYFGRVFGGDVTYRNWNTVTKLAELSSSTGG